MDYNESHDYISLQLIKCIEVDYIPITSLQLIKCIEVDQVSITSIVM